MAIMTKTFKGVANMGNPKHEPTDKTRAEVAALVSFGHTQDEISKHIGISDETLRLYYRHELDTALTRANARVANRLYSKAVDEGDIKALIFWLKTRARWREKDRSDDDKLEQLADKIIDKL